MPFTPSHAVVALPFLRTPIVPAGVAIGAMTPDLPLFVRIAPLSYAWTHSFAWMPATVALALVLLLVWRCVLRPAVGELAPDVIARRLPTEWGRRPGAAVRETFPSVAGAAWLVAALAIGVASHIAWDLFTHEGRWGVAAVPALGQQWGPLTGYKWLQHGSSAFGLVVLAVWALLRLRRRPAAAQSMRRTPVWLRTAWAIALPALLAAAFAWGIVAYGPFREEWTVAHLAYLVLPPAAAAWGIATVVLAAAISFRRAPRNDADLSA